MVRTFAHGAVGERALEHMEAQLIEPICDFRSRLVGELMTSRADVTLVPLDVGGDQILEIFRQSKQSRMPAFESHRDNVVGILHARDLLAVDLNALGSDQRPLCSASPISYRSPSPQRICSIAFAKVTSLLPSW